MHGIWGWIFTMPTIGNNWLECELIFFNFINRDVLFYLFFVKTYCYRMLFCLRSLMKNIFSSSSFHFIFFFLPPPPLLLWCYWENSFACLEKHIKSIGWSTKGLPSAASTVQIIRFWRSVHTEPHFSLLVSEGFVIIYKENTLLNK